MALVGPSALAAQSTADFAGAERQVARGRFVVVSAERDARLADQLLVAALANDSFPGLPRPRAQVVLAIAPDAARFRAWIGPAVPEWGAAIAIPSAQRIIMQGRQAGSDAGDPRVVLRHELAHLALHEALGDLPPRWFDEGYASVAAGEWNRESAFETSMGMVWSTLPSRDSLNAGFYAQATRATWSYAVAHRVVAELEALDPVNGLTNFFAEWRRTGSFEMGVRSAYGLTGAQFDRHWQSQTRRRFGALALVANLSLVAGIFGMLLGPLFIMRRRRDRRRLDAMRAADAASERALQESALAALLADPTCAASSEGAADDAVMEGSVTPVSASASEGLVGGGGRQVSSSDD